jgi:medium-chain acyl-[acyl-carrier-protein] hydrolase
MVTAALPWFPYGCGHAGSIRLLCLPHAGAGASVYRAWGTGAPSPIATVPVQPPGREERFAEIPHRYCRPLVKELADEVCGHIRPPYAVFGHSVGALMAFELVREMRRRRAPAPAHLFVAGRHAPHLPNIEPELRGIPTDMFPDQLRRLGGTPEALLADPDLMAAIVTLLRADFSVNEAYSYALEPPLDLPITAFASTADPRAEQWAVAAWASETSRPFELRVLPGGHFAVLKHAAFVHATIAAALERSYPLGRVADTHVS